MTDRQIDPFDGQCATCGAPRADGNPLYCSGCVEQWRREEQLLQDQYEREAVRSAVRAGFRLRF